MSSVIWFLLVESTGKPYKGTTADFLSLAAGSVVAQFRDAVKAKYTNRLSCVDLGELSLLEQNCLF
jgi:hypothetical protein